MKRIIDFVIFIIMHFILFCYITSCATTAHAESKWFSWDDTNTALHVPLTVLYVVDYRQTIWISENPHTPLGNGWTIYNHHKESNFILGPNPSRGDIDKYFISTYALTTFAVWILPEKWSHGLQAGVISIEIYAVNNNYQLGVEFNF